MESTILTSQIKWPLFLSADGRKVSDLNCKLTPLIVLISFATNFACLILLLIFVYRIYMCVLWNFFQNDSVNWFPLCVSRSALRPRSTHHPFDCTAFAMVERSFLPMAPLFSHLSSSFDHYFFLWSRINRHSALFTSSAWSRLANLTCAQKLLH